MTEPTPSAEQQQAIAHQGPLMVMAGAGSGKTTVLALRIAHLVTSGLCDPFQLLAVTFSVKASRELRDRLNDLVAPEQARQMTVCTLHALGLRMLREHGDLLGYALDANRRRPRVLPQAENRAVLARCAQEAGQALSDGGDSDAAALVRRASVPEIADAISQAKAGGIAPDAYAAGCGAAGASASRAGVQCDVATSAQQAVSSQHAARRAIAACYSLYQAALKAADAVDFDDLILQPLLLLRSQPDALSFYRARWQHVLVDEFQDTSRAQYEILSRIAGQSMVVQDITTRSGAAVAGQGGAGQDGAPKDGAAQDGAATNRATGVSVTVIGDPMQSVYAFRGAMGGEGFEQFRRDFPAARVVYLPHNFRSSANIIAVGAALLGEGAPRQVAVKAGGPPVILLRAGSEHEEAATIAQEAARAAASGFVRYEECAVLCRTNAQIGPIEKALLDASVPYTVVGRGTFFDYPETRHLLAYLSLSQDSLGDGYALRQIVNAPTRGLGPVEQEALRGDAPELTVEHLLDRARAGQLHEKASAGLKQLLDALYRLEQRRDWLPDALIDFILADEMDGERGVGYGRHLLGRPDTAERLERAQGLRRLAQPFGTVREFLDEVEVMSGQDPLSPAGRDRVQVMTLHDAKGLEFRLVFLAGLEEGRIPHFYDQASRRGLEEERRLCYVGFSRATDALCLSFARTRNGRPATPSRFLQGLPAAIIRRGAPAWAAFTGAAFTGAATAGAANAGATASAGGPP